MENVLFVIAMEKESKQIVKELDMKELSENLYESEDKKKRLLITGVGKQLTAINLSGYLENNPKPELIINVGYAGSTDIEIGKWVNISRVYNYEWEIPGEEKYVMYAGGSQKLELLENPDIEKVECYSSESFVTDTDIEEHIAFDMELHSIALICDLNEIPLLSLKKISDNLSIEKYYDNLKNYELCELVSCINLLKKVIYIER